MIRRASITLNVIFFVITIIILSNTHNAQKKIEEINLIRG